MLISLAAGTDTTIEPRSRSWIAPVGSEVTGAAIAKDPADPLPANAANIQQLLLKATPTPVGPDGGRLRPTTFIQRSTPTHAAEQIVEAGITARTPTTLTSPRVLWQQLSRVREEGIGYDQKETESGRAAWPPRCW